KYNPIRGLCRPRVHPSSNLQTPAMKGDNSLRGRLPRKAAPIIHSVHPCSGESWTAQIERVFQEPSILPKPHKFYDALLKERVLWYTQNHRPSVRKKKI